MPKRVPDLTSRSYCKIGGCLEIWNEIPQPSAFVSLTHSHGSLSLAASRWCSKLMIGRHHEGQQLSLSAVGGRLLPRRVINSYLKLLHGWVDLTPAWAHSCQVAQSRLISIHACAALWCWVLFHAGHFTDLNYSRQQCFSDYFLLKPSFSVLRWPRAKTQVPESYFFWPDISSRTSQASYCWTGADSCNRFQDKIKVNY